MSNFGGAFKQDVIEDIAHSTVHSTVRGHNGGMMREPGADGQ
jgi:hypothetical protein